MFVPSRKAAKLLGLHPHTLRKYADNGSIRTIRNEAGQRLYDVDSYIGHASNERTVCYARVSTYKQRADLDRQCAALREKYPDSETISDIGSGLNFKRKGLISLLERALSGEKLCVVITWRDRLARFGFDLIEWLVKRNGGRIVVLHKVESSPQSELAADLIAIITCFSARMPGLGSYRNAIKKDFAGPDAETKTEVPPVDGDL